MRTGDKGIELIKHFEGFSSRLYKCPAGYHTIGYGHRIIPDINDAGMTVTRDQADAILRIDLSVAEKAVRRYINPIVFEGEKGQGKFDALVSFTFNLGGGALQRSSLRRKINYGDPFDVEREFGKWVIAGGKKWKGLIDRRYAEAVLFIYG